MFLDVVGHRPRLAARIDGGVLGHGEGLAVVIKQALENYRLDLRTKGQAPLGARLRATPPDRDRRRTAAFHAFPDARHAVDLKPMSTPWRILSALEGPPTTRSGPVQQE